MATGGDQGFHKCSESAEFYCNACHDKLCVLCNATRDHDILRADDALFPRKDKCEIHKTLPYIMHCKQCEVPVCTKCIHNNHPKHLLVELDSNTRPSALIAVIKLFEVELENITTCRHISCLDSTAWVSDQSANAVLTDVQGNQLEWMKTASGHGYHALTGNGDFMFADQFKRVVYTRSKNKRTEIFIKTGSWRPTCLYVSKMNRNVLIAMCKENKVNVRRFTEDGTEIQKMQCGENGENLFNYPSYITENSVNGDICVSDSGANAVVVVNKHGGHRFNYTGRPRSQFIPSGLCTDSQGHILVYAYEYQCGDNVFLLNQHGQLLSILLTFKRYDEPQGICVDMYDRLWCGYGRKIQVHAYLRHTDKTPALKN